MSSASPRRCPGSSGYRAIPTKPRAPASRRGYSAKGSPMCVHRSLSTCAKRHGAWRMTRRDAMISLNMVHIAPWEAGLGLLAGGKRLLRPDGVLFLYGPFMIGGKHTATTNAAFDAALKQRDPRWGVRDVDDIVSEATPNGLELREVVDMPANNLSLVLVKSSPADPT